LGGEKESERHNAAATVLDVPRRRLAPAHTLGSHRRGRRRSCTSKRTLGRRQPAVLLAGEALGARVGVERRQRGAAGGGPAAQLQRHHVVQRRPQRLRRLAIELGLPQRLGRQVGDAHVP